MLLKQNYHRLKNVRTHVTFKKEKIIYIFFHIFTLVWNITQKAWIVFVKAFLYRLKGKNNSEINMLYLFYNRTFAIGILILESGQTVFKTPSFIRNTFISINLFNLLNIFCEQFMKILLTKKEVLTSLFPHKRIQRTLGGHS